MDNGFMKSPNQHVLVIGMGGTIAGLAQDPKNPSAYRSGQVALESLIPSVQSSTGVAQGEIRTVQLANIDSRDLTESHLTQLGLAVRGVGAVAVVTGVGKDRLDVAVIVEFGGRGSCTRLRTWNGDRAGLGCRFAGIQAQCQNEEDGASVENHKGLTHSGVGEVD